MPVKQVLLEGVAVKIYKRRRVRSLRLSIVGDGTVRVTQPLWLPYKAGVEFATSRKQWILDNVVLPELLMQHQNVGKSYMLEFRHSERNKLTTRVTHNRVIVTMPQDADETDESVQQAASRAVDRALKKDTEAILLPRLQSLADEHGFLYRSAKAKKMKSRWGSCSSKKDIIINSYLVQLPWALIDYVLLHELQHTKILAHGPKFWSALAEHVPNLTECRKAMKEHKARIL